MIIHIQKDNQKAKMLLDMAVITLKRLNESEKEKYPSNTLNDYYDIIHKLLESLTLSDGIKIKGEGAHQELIDYIAKVHGMGESDRLFLQELRDYRNRIAYEGFIVNRNYIIYNTKRIESLIEIITGHVRKSMDA